MNMSFGQRMQAFAGMMLLCGMMTNLYVGVVVYMWDRFRIDSTSFGVLLGIPLGIWYAFGDKIVAALKSCWSWIRGYDLLPP